MSFTTTDRSRYLYLGLQPPHPNPHYKHNYTKYNEYRTDRGPDSDVPMKKLHPRIDPYRKYEKTAIGMSMNRTKLYHQSYQTELPYNLYDEYTSAGHEDFLNFFGLYHEVPAGKYTIRRRYIEPTRYLSMNEKNPFDPAYRSIDKPNSSLFVTEKGVIRNTAAICDGSSRRVRTAFREDYHPRWIYQPPNWTKEIF